MSGRTLVRIIKLIKPGWSLVWWLLTNQLGRLVIIAQVAVFICFFSSSSLAQQVEKDVIATVGGKAITRQDLDDAIKDRIDRDIALKAYPALRTAVLKDLIAELAVEEAVSEKTLQRDRQLARRLETIRRQFLLKYYLERNLPTENPSLEKVDKYIREHPEFFANRSMYVSALPIPFCRELSDCAKKPPGFEGGS